MIIAKDGDVVLRELTKSDIPKLAEYANNEKVSINLRDAFPSPYTQEDARQFIAMVDRQQPKTFFAIAYKDQYAGNISLLPGADVYKKSAEIGYFIGEPFWNMGIMTKAVRLITDYGFKHFDLVRIHTGVFEYNKASQRVLEKCGFIKEGVSSKAVFKNNHFYDEIRYALLNDAYNAIQKP
ncbi:MAG TPA: GNAT family protein [Bacteroidales bacterium]|jgi:RimJ/RimL family protein N-acetyltransferase|nr:GNAT family N-acetyltransferase [Bacteroidales bacterium]HNZ42820.1 GNAT family protein [Bacteroidales bacterium]HOH84022.1 GNAT family protein [Bacteroidales bacterium]HPB24993.1 GNAT family protein [Bacteroidales bacterium]HPI30245.1 GNAT family protein [Bacteroidales bacterium]